MIFIDEIAETMVTPGFLKPPPRKQLLRNGQMANGLAGVGRSASSTGVLKRASSLMNNGGVNPSAGSMIPTLQHKGMYLAVVYMTKLYGYDRMTMV